MVHNVPKTVPTRQQWININTDLPKHNRINIRRSEYLNTLIEQDQRRIKRRRRPMLELKNVRRAQILLAGIEVRCLLRKAQYLHPLENFFHRQTPFIDERCDD